LHFAISILHWSEATYLIGYRPLQKSKCGLKNAKVKMQIEKCEIEAICQDGYQSSQDDFAICTLQFPFCTGAKRQ